MPDIDFTKDETNRIVEKIKTYFTLELDQDIGGFEAEFLMQFFAKEIGPFFYNRGLLDAQAILREKAEEASYLIDELEQPTGQ